MNRQSSAFFARKTGFISYKLFFLSITILLFLIIHHGNMKNLNIQ